MAAIEIEFAQDRFEQFALLILSAGANPFPALQGLRPERLIAKLTWDAVQLGMTPPGVITAPGALAARVNLTVRHVSTDELDANANAPGATSSGVAWLSIFARSSPAAIAVQVVGIDLVGAAPQRFSPPVDIGATRLDRIARIGEPIAAAILLQNGIVTVRFITSTFDNLFASPLNLLNETDDNWLFRLSFEVFTDTVLRTIRDGLEPLPPDTSIEDPAEAYWEESDGAWRVSGSIGVEKEDACPGLLEDADVSVTIDVLLTPTPNVNTEVLDLTLRLESDASDWDAFRCWLGSLGLVSIGLAFVSLPVGFFAGIASLAAVGSEVGKQAGAEVGDTDLEPDFKKVASDKTSVTYTGQVDLPKLGPITRAVTGRHGLVVSGTMIFLPADHGVFYTPGGPNLKTRWHGDYNCEEHRWHASLLIEGIDITDTATIGPAFYARVPVKVFPTSLVKPANQWALNLPTAALFDQYVTVSRKNALPLGQTGRVYLHTSAGLRRFDIDQVPLFVPPNDIASSLAEFNCRNFARDWTRVQKLEWLVDPPAWDSGLPVLRQWLLTISEVPEGATITIRRHRDGREYGAPISFTADRSASAAIELVTDGTTELEMEHTLETKPEGRMVQRWLVPQRIVELGAPARAITRAQNQVAVRTGTGVTALDLRTGEHTVHSEPVASYEHHHGHVDALRTHFHRLAALFKHHLKDGPEGRVDHVVPPFSVTLRDGRVAAAWDDKLVIARPWGSRG